MAKQGESTLLLDEQRGMSKSPEKTGDDAVSYSEELARGSSNPKQGQDVMMVAEQIAQGPGQPPGQIYYVDFTSGGNPTNPDAGSKFYNVNPDTLEPEGSGTGLGYELHGVGGDQSVIWIGDNNDESTVRKYNAGDLSLIESVSIPIPQTEVGGTKDVLYAVSSTDPRELVKYDPGTGNVVQRVDSPGPNEDAGIGGTQQRCWHTDGGNIYELDPQDLTSVRNQNSGFGYSDMAGCGGSNDRLYALNLGSPPTVLRFDPDTLELIDARDVDFGTEGASGIGGF